MGRNIISVLDIKDDIEQIIDLGLELKNQIKVIKKFEYLKGKILALIFERASARTRVSFEAGMKLLGGDTIVLSGDDIKIGKRESAEDVGKVLSRYVDIIVYRPLNKVDLDEFAKNSSVPVINGLDEREHPCQILTDLMTIKEKKGKLYDLNFVFIGDGNRNLAHSYLLGCSLVGMNTTIISPKKYWPSDYYVEHAKKNCFKENKQLLISDTINDAKDADVIATDTWISLWDEKERQERMKQFNGYTINETILKEAKRDAIFLHCMPIYYGEEVVKEVAYCPQSVIIDEAENHMWVQMALLLRLLHDYQEEKVISEYLISK
jgi:ornithine carbamoyltransferase